MKYNHNGFERERIRNRHCLLALDTQWSHNFYHTVSNLGRSCHNHVIHISRTTFSAHLVCILNCITTKFTEATILKGSDNGDIIAIFVVIVEAAWRWASDMSMLALFHNVNGHSYMISPALGAYVSLITNHKFGYSAWIVSIFERVQYAPVGLVQCRCQWCWAWTYLPHAERCAIGWRTTSEFSTTNFFFSRGNSAYPCPTNSVNYRRGIFSPIARVGMPPTTRGTNST